MLPAGTFVSLRHCKRLGIRSHGLAMYLRGGRQARRGPGRRVRRRQPGILAFRLRLNRTDWLAMSSSRGAVARVKNVGGWKYRA